MKEQKAEKLFQGITDIGDDLIQEAGIVQLPRRKKVSGWRWGVIAAVLCAVLAGTGFAAANPGVVAGIIEKLTIQVDNSGYHVGGVPMTKYPLSDFSPALLNASEERESPVVTECFSTWDEVRAFLGEDIPVVWPDGGRDWDGPFYVYLFHVETNQLWGIDINSISLSRQEEVYIEIRTEHWKGSEASSGLGIAEGRIEEMGSYAMRSGCTAEMVKYLGSEEHPAASCTGHFVKDGIMYDAAALGTVPTQEEMETRLKAILDSFE